MQTLSLEDFRCLQAAIGWLELGNQLEANLELERIPESRRSHPEVLKVRWRISAKAKKWELCLQVGQTLVDFNPEDPTGWIFHAQSYYGMRRYQEAHDTLKKAASFFPGQPYLLYDLACYQCLLGQIEEARSTLKQAFALDPALKAHAMEDPDLQALRNEGE